MAVSSMGQTATHLQRLARLDLAVFDELRTDASATIPSLAVAAGSTLLLALGGWLWWLTSGLGDTSTVFVKSVLIGSVFSMALWLAWLAVVAVVMQRVGHVEFRMEELVRSAGFAAAPLALGVFMVIPQISFGVGVLAIALWLLFTQEAVNRVLGDHGGAATIANAAGFAVWAIGMSVLATATSQLAPGPFLAESIWDALTGLHFTVSAG